MLYVCVCCGKERIGTGVPPRREDLAIKVGTKPRSQANYLAKDLQGVAPFRNVAEEKEECYVMVAKF